MSNKYNARRVEYDGHKFDSAAEARRYIWLKDEQDQGRISHLTPHPPYVILDKRGNEREWKHIPDFRYFEIATNKTVFEDVKGVATELWKLKRRLFVDRYCNEHVEYRTIPARDC